MERATAAVLGILGLFQEYDCHKTGVVSFKELKDVLLGIGMTEPSCMKLLSGIHHKDGDVNYVKFLQRVFSEEHDALRKDALAKLTSISPLAVCKFVRDQVPSILHADAAFMLEAVRLRSEALEFAADEIKANPDVVRAAVQKAGRALRFASHDRRADHAIVLEAVKQHGCALEFATDEMKADCSIVLEAVKQNAFALQFAKDAAKKPDRFA